ncbi:sigma-70 family RNA polymerase sigma factor [Planctomycetota bacterium]
MQQNVRALDLEKIVLDWQQPLFNLAFRMLGDKNDASDATQEIFMNIIKNFSQYDPAREIKPWLYGLATNVICNIIRDSKLRKQKERDLTTMNQYPDQADLIDRREQQEILQTQLTKLEKEERALLILHYYCGCSQVEIASALMLSRTTVQSQMYNALTSLKTKLKNTGLLAVIPNVEVLMQSSEPLAVPTHLNSILLSMAAKSAPAISVATGLTTGGIIMTKKIIAAVVIAGIVSIVAGIGIANIKKSSKKDDGTAQIIEDNGSVVAQAPKSEVPLNQLATSGESEADHNTSGQEHTPAIIDNKKNNNDIGIELAVPVVDPDNHDTPEDPKVPVSQPATPEVSRSAEFITDYLETLATTQNENGSWDADVLDGQTISSVGVTAYCMLGFLGAGYTQNDDKHGPVISKALAFVSSKQWEDGSFSTSTNENAIIALAVIENYGLTNDKNFQAVCGKSVKYIQGLQNPEGGWPYSGRHGKSDIISTGWNIMALKSAKVCGLPVNQKQFDSAIQWLKGQTDPTTGTIIDQDWATATAIGIVIRKFTGENSKSPIIKKATESFLKNLLINEPENFAYWYWGSQAMFQIGGEAWKIWNKTLGEVFDRNPLTIKVGPVSLALRTLQLEIYYRYDAAFK